MAHSTPTAADSTASTRTTTPPDLRLDHHCRRRGQNQAGAKATPLLASSSCVACFTSVEISSVKKLGDLVAVKFLVFLSPRGYALDVLLAQAGVSVLGARIRV
jgi:hypothetical protein